MGSEDSGPSSGVAGIAGYIGSTGSSMGTGPVPAPGTAFGPGPEGRAGAVPGAVGAGQGGIGGAEAPSASGWMPFLFCQRSCQDHSLVYMHLVC